MSKPRFQSLRNLHTPLPHRNGPFPTEWSCNLDHANNPRKRPHPPFNPPQFQSGGARGGPTALVLASGLNPIGRAVYLRQRLACHYAECRVRRANTSLRKLVEADAL